MRGQQFGILGIKLDFLVCTDINLSEIVLPSSWAILFASLISGSINFANSSHIADASFNFKNI